MALHIPLLLRNLPVEWELECGLIAWVSTWDGNKYIGSLKNKYPFVVIHWDSYGNPINGYDDGFKLKQHGEVKMSDNDVKEYARELGKRGGVIGGYARAANLTSEERIEIGRKAAKARWEKRQSLEAEENNPVIAISLSIEDWEALDALAYEDDRPLEYYCRRVLKGHLSSRNPVSLGNGGVQFTEPKLMNADKARETLSERGKEAAEKIATVFTQSKKRKRGKRVPLIDDPRWVEARKNSGNAVKDALNELFDTDIKWTHGLNAVNAYYRVAGVKTLKAVVISVDWRTMSAQNDATITKALAEKGVYNIQIQLRQKIIEKLAGRVRLELDSVFVGKGKIQVRFHGKIDN